MSKIVAVSMAIKNALMMCREWREMECCGNAIIELCTAFEMDDEEIIEALKFASGNSVQEDDFIDNMIANIQL